MQVSSGYRFLQDGESSLEYGETIYDSCLHNSTSDRDIIECITNKLESGQIIISRDTNTWFLIFATSLIFFMQAGFAMLCAGSVRIKNVGNTMLKNLLDTCGAAIGFFTIGFAFAFGGQHHTDTTGTTFIGSSNFLLQGINDNDYAYYIFEFAFAATCATIVAGTLAERCQMAAYLCYSIILTGFIFPVVAHAIWSRNGFLSATNVNPFLGVGAIDFAGGTVVHVTGGATALFASIILGPRKGRFYDARGNPLPKPKPHPGHSVALQMLGTFILWFGWYGFNAGSTLTHSPYLNTGNIAALAAVNTTLSAESGGVAALFTPYLNTGNIAALAAVNTTLSAASGGVAALFTSLFIEERLTGEAKFDLKKLMNGCLGGLVSITAGCAIVEPWAAAVIGLMGGWVYLLSSALLISYRIDDAVDAIPVHLACGMWGTLAVGLLASPARVQNTYRSSNHVGWFYSLGRGSFDAHLLAAQICCILFVIAWVFILMLPFFSWLNYMGWFRSDSLEELVGLDISYHGVQALAGDEIKLEYVEAFNRRRARYHSSNEQLTNGNNRENFNLHQIISRHQEDISFGQEGENEDIIHNEDVNH